MRVTYIGIDETVILHHEMECVPRESDSVTISGTLYTVSSVNWRVFQAMDATKKENNAVITLEKIQ